MYAKYRFLSYDEVHKHFRMAAFFQGSYSKNQPYYDELSMDGDQSGIQLGIIATQLINKLAVSASLSNVQVLQTSRWEKRSPQAYPCTRRWISHCGGGIFCSRVHIRIINNPILTYM